MTVRRGRESGHWRVRGREVVGGTGAAVGMGTGALMQYIGAGLGVKRRCVVDDVALANYVIGISHGLVEAGRIDPVCARALGVESCTPIWFSDYTLLKLHERHGEITFEHYRYMPNLLLRGFLARSRKPRHLELWWLDEVGSEPAALLTVLKASVLGEVFAATFHPIHRKEARRLARKAAKEGRLIRSQRDYEDIRKI